MFKAGKDLRNGITTTKVTLTKANNIIIKKIQKNLKKKKKKFKSRFKESPILYNTMSDANKRERQERIIEMFNTRVKGKAPPPSDSNHDGAEGQWLEYLLTGQKPNSSNEADYLGFEMKKESNKISLGDWCASAYLFDKKKKKKHKYGLCEEDMSKIQFLTYFGTPKAKKNGRYSWSGKCFPKYGEEWNFCGQRLIFDASENLICEYSFQHDTRKVEIPIYLKSGIIRIAFWERNKLNNHINKKFNQRGFFICKKNKFGIYNKIGFGDPFDFGYFVVGMKARTIILDSGMKEGNSRKYSSFRSPKAVWNNLITEEY